eukprot:CAMPEP_0198207172 /NCGR_PEP_ID=MMETSP1445-20131203/10654_1 /TAXON_ID=36898 /ORGANISM="Pyramimonas sp., Strain CCMP2087" /LENGTH=540 /DNA_ID=CAMNT_0043880117 /DNA_START=309 /DNA_END=1928 /DNA_ORIENTATION=+
MTTLPSKLEEYVCNVLKSTPTPSARLKKAILALEQTGYVVRCDKYEGVFGAYEDEYEDEDEDENEYEDEDEYKCDMCGNECGDEDKYKHEYKYLYGDDMLKYLYEDEYKYEDEDDYLYTKGNFQDFIKMGGSGLVQDAERRASIHESVFESVGNAVVVSLLLYIILSFLRRNAKNKKRSKSKTVPSAAAAASAAALAARLISEEEAQEPARPSKQGSSNKPRRHRHRSKANQDETATGAKERDEAVRGNVASSSARRGNAGERGDRGRNSPRHSKSDGEIEAHGGEENAGPVIDNDGQSHNEPEGSNSSNVQWVEASSIDYEADTSHCGVEQLTSTQAERRQQTERERKGKQRQRKRATARATLEEALARVDTAGASLDTTDALDAAIVSARRILNAPVMSSSIFELQFPSVSSDLPELLRQAEERLVNLREARSMVKAAAAERLEYAEQLELLDPYGLVQSALAESSAQIEKKQQSSVEPPPSETLPAVIASAEAVNGSSCVVCLAAPKDSLLLPCKHLAMCAGCTKAVMTSSSQPQCP